MNTLKPTMEELSLTRAVEGFPLSLAEQYPIEAPMTSQEIYSLTMLPASLGPVVRFLRSDQPLSTFMRCWMADLMDANADTEMRLVLRHRKGKRPKNTQIRQTLLSQNAALYAEKRKAELADKSDKRAVLDACAEYHLSESTVRAALADLKQVRSIQATVGAHRRNRGDSDQP